MAKASAVPAAPLVGHLGTVDLGSSSAASRSNERLVFVASHVGVRPCGALVSYFLPRPRSNVSRTEMATPHIVEVVDAGLEVAAVVVLVDELSSSALRT